MERTILSSSGNPRLNPTHEKFLTFYKSVDGPSLSFFVVSRSGRRTVDSCGIVMLTTAFTRLLRNCLGGKGYGPVSFVFFSLCGISDSGDLGLEWGSPIPRCPGPTSFT